MRRGGAPCRCRSPRLIGLVIVLPTLSPRRQSTRQQQMASGESQRLPILGDGQHGQPLSVSSRHGNNSDLWKARAQLSDGFRAVLIRHVQVGDYQVGGAGAIPLTPSLPSAARMTSWPADLRVCSSITLVSGSSSMIRIRAIGSGPSVPTHSERVNKKPRQRPAPARGSARQARGLTTRTSFGTPVTPGGGRRFSGVPHPHLL